MNIQWFHVWLWFWFGVGSGLYMLKRAYYLVTGPNPVAVSYFNFLEVCWVPLLIRFAVDSGVYWFTFYPDLINPTLRWLGSFGGWNWQVHSAMPQYAPIALFFGLGIDNILDFGFSKIPWLKDWLPQMPPPMKDTVKV